MLLGSCILLIVAGAIVVYRMTSAGVADEAARRPAARDRAATAGGEIPPSTAPAREPIATKENSAGAAARGSVVDPAAIYQETIKALNEPIPTERLVLLGKVLAGLSAGNWRAMLQAFDDERKLHGRDHASARAFFVLRAGEVIGLDAVTYFLESKDTAAARSALTGWASKSPDEALGWLAKQSRETGSAAFVGDAIRGLALAEPDLALSFLDSVPVAERKKYTPGLISTVVSSAGLEQAQKLVDDMITRANAAGTLQEDYLASVFRDLTAIKAKRANVSGNLEPAMDWLNQHVGRPYLDGLAVRDAAAQFANQDPLKTIEWLDSVNSRAKFPGFTAVGYGFVMDVWTANAGLDPAASWLNTHTAHPSYDRIASHYADLAVAKNASLASQIAGSIKDPAIRTDALKRVQQAQVAQAAKKK